MINWLINKWYLKKLSPSLYILVPFAFLYQYLILLRRWLYRFSPRKKTHFKVPVIVVGNITVGGTGKTPLVIYLAQCLQKKGYNPGIVSRGYGGKSAHYPYVVGDKSNPEEVGDEALLLAQKTRCPVVIDPHRVAAVKKLLTDYPCDVILSDDGLQHYALTRNIEIVVIDGDRQFGNGWCLPAGPLREPISVLEKADFIVVNAPSNEISFPELKKNISIMQLRPGKIYNLYDPHLKASELKDKTIHAVAGIGNPKRFFQLLRHLGFSVIEHAFPDHYQYQPEDLEFGVDATIIMTEKDAVKCQAWANAHYWCLPVSAEIDSAFIKTLLNKFVGSK